MSASHARPYASPYVAGAGLGLVLLTSYVLAGRGVGATGAFAAVAASAANAVAPASTQGNVWFAPRLPGASLLGNWLVVEMLCVALGGFLSAALAGRLRLGIDRGAHIGALSRLAIAGAGGVVMGAGAVFARGCTSGQALTGGALLSVGSWLFVGGAFAAGFLTMLVVRRAWT